AVAKVAEWVAQQSSGDATAEEVYNALKSKAKSYTYLPANPSAPKEIGANHFLKHQLQADGARFARIYGFSYEGAYYALPRPALFLVHREGEAVSISPNDYRTNMNTSGVAAREWEFSSGDKSDLRRWDYDKGDFSIRMDIETGPFDQILLEAMLRGGPSFASGANLRSGANVASGANLRSGANLGVGGIDPRDRR
ncbi:MAG: hypothetical protein JO010_07560, partial [Alphaproteobacteria bacterium]|nr:hypothetical protein [Alphaproteobacteria bacterium]